VYVPAETLNVTVFEAFWDIAFIRATWRSVATWRAADESLSVGSQVKRLGTAMPITTDAIPIATISSSTVNPEAARLYPNFLMITPFLPFGCN